MRMLKKPQKSNYKFMQYFASWLFAHELQNANHKCMQARLLTCMFTWTLQALFFTLNICTYLANQLPKYCEKLMSYSHSFGDFGYNIVSSWCWCSDQLVVATKLNLKHKELVKTVGWDLTRTRGESLSCYFSGSESIW